MYKWKKLGKIFDPTLVNDREWLNEFAQAPSIIEFNKYIRVYFSCRPKPDHNGQYVSYSSYVDLDKNNFFNIVHIANKPILKLGELGTFDEFGTYPVSVIKDNDNYIVYYGGWTRCESVPFNVAIGRAVSKDSGKTFKKVGSGPILSYSKDEPFILSGPKIRKFNGVYYLFYIAGRQWLLANGKPEPVYKIRVATSNDGLNWNKHNKDLIEDILGDNEAQASPDVIFSNGKYHMFFCYRQATDFRENKNRSYRIGYAYSKDLLNWTRDDKKVGIDVSENGWDSEMLAYPHLFKINKKIYMFYLGNQVGKYGFGVAELDGELK
ncbi:MAG: glycosylase [Epsilonproteobacteria bacterium]|nr:MAG: glycosylase [Campylobacterota bacterium]